MAYSVVTQQLVNVKISSNATSFLAERRVDKDNTIVDLKGKLELQTGCSTAAMKLELFDKDDNLVCKLDNDGALLGSFPIEDGMRIHATDPNKKLGEYEDTSKVEKFELTEDEYSHRTDTVRAFKQRMKLGRFADADPEEARRQAELIKAKEDAEKAAASKIKAGDRCEARLPNAPPRRGTVRFVGETEFKPGMWVGVQYDEPVGKNDGSVQGHRYFECPPKYGGFVKPDAVEVGDFPEEGFSDDDLDEI